jgi:hypothetical protein
MARPHSIRRERASSARPPNPVRTPVSEARRARHRRSSRLRTGERSSALQRPLNNLKLIAQLRETAELLRVVYSTCVTAELALQGQNADQDGDILRALRMHVSAPVSRQAERLDELLSELCGREKGAL